MEMLVLEANLRDATVKSRKIRKTDKIPSVCYGKGFDPMSLQVDYQSFRKIFREAGSSQVINLSVDGKKVPVLVHDIAYDSLTDNFEHVDFLQVNLKEKVTANVPVEIEGEAPAVKNFNGVVTVSKHEIEVNCLPMDIPHEIKIDVSKLENIGDSIHISDLKLGDKVEILDDPETVLVTVSAVEEFVEQVVEVPEELKAEPTEAAEGEAKEGASEEKKEEKAE